MEKEAIAILQAAKHYNQSNHNKVIIQTNSLSMEKILNNKWECLWSIADNVKQICQLISIKQV